MSKRLNVLHVEDSRDDSAFVLRVLRKSDLEIHLERVETANAMAEALEKRNWDIILADFALPQFSGLAALKLLQQSNKDLPFVIVSGAIGEETAVEAMKAGASDYVMKNNLARLIPVIEREIQESKVRQERRRMEEALRESENKLHQAQKLEAVGRLAGGIAHDFNNILTMIIGNSDLILMERGLDASIRESVQDIKQSVERAASLTQRLLAFSHKQVLQLRRINLNELISNLEKMLKRLIQENISFVTKLDPNTGQINADPGQIDQIIINLALNARDAMPNGGKLILETQKVFLDGGYCRQHPGVAPGSYVLLAVSDTGHGMDEETKDHIFEPFFTTKGVGKGTGLGLSIVYGIVKQSGGNIWVYSEPEHGTIFKIYLPQIEEDENRKEAVYQKQELKGGKETILLVEDEKGLRKVVCKLLQRYGYTITQASNGDEALETIAKSGQGEIDLLITDVIMPGMGGKDLSEKLHDKYPELKVLYISGYTDNSIVHNGVLEERVAFLQKPFSVQNLTQKVREVLDG